MLNIKIVLGEEFVGFNSGWPTRYIGLISELSKYNQLSIFAPGNTFLFHKMYSKAFVCEQTILNPVQIKKGYFKFIKEFLKVSRFHSIIPGDQYSPEFHNIIVKDTTKYDVSIYFGRDAFVYYGLEDQNSCIFCDFCDSYLRHKYNNLRKISGLEIKKIANIFFDISYMKRFKKKYFPSNVKVIAITDSDCEYISSVLNKNSIYTVPNGTEYRKVENIQELIKEKYRSKYIVFVGSLDYKPNVESILYSVENIWPEIYSKFPDKKFRIVGRAPSKYLKKSVYGIEGIELVGQVDDVEKYYVNSKYFLGPMFSGGGMKNKFLESVNAGSPIITTPEGAIGIDLITNMHGKICETKSDLIKGALDLLSCSEYEYANYVTSCLSLSKENSWENVGKSFNELILKNIG